MRKRDLSVRKSGVTHGPHWLVHVNGLTLLYIREKTAIHFTVLKMLGATHTKSSYPCGQGPRNFAPPDLVCMYLKVFICVCVCFTLAFLAHN